MKYNRRARLNTSEVRDVRRGGGSGGRTAAIGGGGAGVLGLVIYLIVSAVGGGSGAGNVAGQIAASVLGQLGQNGQPATADNSEIEQNCKTGQDANTKLECAVVADIDSIQAFWAAELPKVFHQDYVPIPTVWFSGQVSTGCGPADSGAGPFYCPADNRVYIDLSFYDDIKSEFHATGGLFVDAYVLAHEYGHHVQDLLGTEAKVQTRQGATSDSVRLELQADCYAGVWANHASTTPTESGKPLITDVTQDDIASALDTASRIGDDYIQTKLGGGQVNSSQFTHGTSAQRKKWFTTGFQTGEPARCDTFGTNNLG